MGPKRIILRSTGSSSVESLPKPPSEDGEDSDISLDISEAEEETDIELEDTESVPASTGYYSDSEDGEDANDYRPTKMTARQKSRLAAASDENLSTGPETVSSTMAPKKLTEEELLKRNEKSRRRKMQRDQQLEDSKAETIKKLLQKQSTRSKKMEKSLAPDVPEADAEVVFESKTAKSSALLPAHGHIVYRSDAKNGPLLILGDGISFEQQKSSQLPIPPTCSIKGCRQPRKYTHASKGVPVCSLACYKLVK